MAAGFKQAVFKLLALELLVRECGDRVIFFDPARAPADAREEHLPLARLLGLSEEYGVYFGEDFAVLCLLEEIVVSCVL